MYRIFSKLQQIMYTIDIMLNWFTLVRISCERFCYTGTMDEIESAYFTRILSMP